MARERGRHLVKIDQWLASSKTCAYCDFKIEELPIDVRDLHCPNCAAHDDRAINAGINIRRRDIIELRVAGLVSLRMEARVSPAAA